MTGGVFWRVRYALDADSAFDLYPFKFEPIHADYVFPVFAPGSTKLSEVFVRYQLPREAARAEWGQWSNDWPDLIEYREHWTSARGGLPGTLSITVGVEGTRKEIKTEQNPFGFVPFVYIPHIPSNGFFGIPLAEWAGAVDLAEEYNERLANTGDILKQNSYPFGVLTNYPAAKIKQPFRLWKGGPTIVDLGSGLPDGKTPEMAWFEAADISAGTMTYLDGLKKELRMSMAIPPVAVGEDEGSQRSFADPDDPHVPNEESRAHRTLDVDLADGRSEPHGLADGHDQAGRRVGGLDVARSRSRLTGRRCCPGTGPSWSTSWCSAPALGILRQKMLSNAMRIFHWVRSTTLLSAFERLEVDSRAKQAGPAS